MFEHRKPQKLPVDEILLKLESALKECAADIANMFPTEPDVPSWAANWTDLLYSAQSVPSDLHEAGKLYIAYEQSKPDTIKLLGKTNNKMNVHRELEIEQKGPHRINITSKHINMQTGKFYTCEGWGRDFKTALDDYFSDSDLKQANYVFRTEGNVQKGGDAFLFLNTLRKPEGSDFMVKSIMEAVRKLIDLIPPDKHDAVMQILADFHKSIKSFISSKENEKILLHYDPRLWVIIDSICNHYDSLSNDNAPWRKSERNRIIAKCCSKLLNKEDFIPDLQSYLEAMKMHSEIVGSDKRDDFNEEMKSILEEYKRMKIYPENKSQHQDIRDFHEKCRGKGKEEEPVKPQL